VVISLLSGLDSARSDLPFLRQGASGRVSDGVAFRNDIISGPGGQQILLEDPSGNPIELFQPAA